MKNKKKYLEQLFKLINMLSKGEKKYVGLSIATKKGNQHYQLYEALKKETLRTFTVNKELLYQRFQRTTAKHLFEYIIERMRTYPDGGNNKKFKKKRKEIKLLMLDADFLFARGFYEESFNKLIKAKVKAKLIFHYYALLEINDRIMDILAIKRTQGIAHQIDINEITAENEQILMEAKEYSYWKGIFNELRRILTTSYSPSKKIIIAKYKPLFNTPSKLKSILAEHWYYQASSLYYTVAENSLKLEKFYKKVVTWWEAPAIQQNYKMEEQYRHLVAIANLVNSKINTIYSNEFDKNSLEWKKRIEACWSLLNQKKALKFDNKYEEYIFRINFFRNRFNLYFLENNMSDAKRMFEEEVVKYIDSFYIRDQKIFFIQHLAIIYRQGDYSTCLERIKLFDNKFSVYSESHNLTFQKIEVNIFLLGIIITLQANLEEKIAQKTIQTFRSACQRNRLLLKKENFAEDMLLILKRYINLGKNINQLVRRKETLLAIYKLLKRNQKEIFVDDILEVWIKNHPVLGAEGKNLI